MKHARRGHTAFALTRSAVNDGGKLTKQFFRGTRATSAVEEGFLGAIFRRYGTMRQSVIFKIKEGRSLEFSISPGPQLVDSAIRGHRSLSPERSSPSRPAVVLRTEGCSSPYHVPTRYSRLGLATVRAWRRVSFLASRRVSASKLLNAARHSELL